MPSISVLTAVPSPAPRPPLLKRMRPGHWWLVDSSAAALYGLATASLEGSRSSSAVLVVAVSLLAVAAVVLSRRFPLAGLACALLLAWLAPAESDIGFIALPTVGYALYHCAVQLRPAAAGGALLLSLSAPLATALPDFSHVGAVVPFGLVLVTCATIGVAVGQQRRYAQSVLRHHREQAEAAMAEASRGVTDERLRIARELHDVVAHSMSVITVQAGFAHLVIDDSPAEARASLGAIESTGREVLVEMRRLLGILRSEGAAAGDPDLSPAASLADLDRLVAQTRNAGLSVDLQVTGARRQLPAGLELTAYRIVQESLTNVVRHAATDSVMVVLDFAESSLRIEVSDAGRGPVEGSSGGHGLVGMRERVALYGGTLSAMAGPGAAGFQVVANLPIPVVAMTQPQPVSR
jgi:signal transduction histidine kinase